MKTVKLILTVTLALLLGACTKSIEITTADLQ